MDRVRKSRIQDWLNRLVPVAGFKPVGRFVKKLHFGPIPNPVSIRLYLLDLQLFAPDL